MGEFYEKSLKPCPVCDGKITDKSFDRGIRYCCVGCGFTKSYPGLLQIKVNNYPIPYIDKDGKPIDPKDVKNQEYYYCNANEDAIAEFNNWVDSRNNSKLRDIKIDQILKKVYVVSAIINGSTMSTIGVFDDVCLANKIKDRWNNHYDLAVGDDYERSQSEYLHRNRFEVYINEISLNVDTLLASPEKYLSGDEIELLPLDIIREYKISEIIP